MSALLRPHTVCQYLHHQKKLLCQNKLLNVAGQTMSSVVVVFFVLLVVGDIRWTSHHNRHILSDLHLYIVWSGYNQRAVDRMSFRFQFAVHLNM